MIELVRVLIVDDSAYVRKVIRQMLSRSPFVEVVATAANGREAIRAIKTHKPDLVFLDIQMPGFDGFSVIQGLLEVEPPLFVFVTAFNEHALRAFEAQAVEISLQAGSMVGVEKEERLATPPTKSLKMRHPWLQLNLLTAFLAAAVVGFFQDTIDRLVILALFLPVLAGQSGNTGCQALAVTLRGMTLGELKPGMEKPLVKKEAWLGMLNGAGVGLAAAIGMYVIASGQANDHPVMLSIVVFFAMIGSCVASGLSGALVPLGLKRIGFDPATASSIFLTTATDVVSMGMLLGLATILII